MTGAPDRSSSQSSGKTWNESPISLTCSTVRLRYKDSLTFAESVVTRDASPIVPTSVKITPIVAPSSYQPVISVSLMVCDRDNRIWESVFSLLAAFNSLPGSRSIRTKRRLERSVRFRSSQSILVKSCCVRSPKSQALGAANRFVSDPEVAFIRSILFNTGSPTYRRRTLFFS